MLKKYTKLYIKFVAQFLKVLMEYRTDFFIGLGGFVVRQATGLIFLYIVFEKIPALNGWTFYQVLFIYAFGQIPMGLDHLITDNLWLLSRRLIITSEFDRYLLRPINPLFHLLAEVFQTDALVEIFVGIVLLIWSAAKLNISFGFINILLLIFTILCATVIYSSIKLFFASFAFWIKFSQPILYISYNLSDFSKYPISIYGKTIRFILTLVIPFAFTGYFPAGYFIGNIDIYTAILGTFIAAILSSVVAYRTWCMGIKVYESAGN